MPALLERNIAGSATTAGQGAARIAPPRPRAGLGHALDVRPSETAGRDGTRHFGPINALPGEGRARDSGPPCNAFGPCLCRHRPGSSPGSCRVEEVPCPSKTKTASRSVRWTSCRSNTVPSSSEGRPFLEKLPNARCRSLLERHDDNESIHGATLKQRSCPGSRVAQRLSGTDPGGADKNPLRSSPHSNLRVSRLLRAPTGRMIAAYSKDWSSP